MQKHNINYCSTVIRIYNNYRVFFFTNCGNCDIILGMYSLKTELILIKIRGNSCYKHLKPRLALYRYFSIFFVRAFADRYFIFSDSVFEGKEK